MGDTATSTIPLFDPSGTLRDVPMEQMKDALSAGAKPAVRFQAPDKSVRWVPADRTQEATKAGGQILPVEQQDKSFWSGTGAALWDDIKGMASGIAHLGDYDPMTDSKLSQDEKMKLVNQDFADAGTEVKNRTKQYGSTYANVSAPAAGMMGVNVPGMEQSAAEGSGGGVLGHAAAVPAAMAATEGVGRLASLGGKALLLGKTPAEAYQSALKPSTTLPPERVNAMVQTGLQNEIPVSKAGAAKLSSLLEDLQDKVTQEIGNGQGKTISKGAVLQRLNPVADRFSQQVTPASDLNAIADTGTEFAASHPSDIPAADAQAMKVGTYQQLKGKAYGELKSATIESQKALARGLKEELASAFPELSKLNAAESKLYDLEPVLEKAIQRQANHQIAGIGTPIVAGAAKALTGSNTTAAVAGVLKAVVDNPIIKSKLAIALNKAGVPWAESQARVSAYSVALAGAVSGSSSATPDDQNSSPAQ